MSSNVSITYLFTNTNFRSKSMTESDMLDEGIDDGESRFQNIKDKIQKIRRRSSQGEAMARQWNNENKNKVLR